MAKKIIQFLVFGVNLAAVGVGALFFKHQADEKSLAMTDAIAEVDTGEATGIADTTSTQDLANSAVQNAIATDRQAKLDQMANNPATVTETQSIQKLVPGTGVTVTKKTTGGATTTSTSTPKSTTTTKKS